MGNFLCKNKKVKDDEDNQIFSHTITPINEESLNDISHILHQVKQPEDDHGKKHVEKLCPEDIIIENLVKKYIQDKHINSKLIPDFIERKLYRNVLKIITGILKDTLENAEIKVLDHRIKFTIEPIIAEKILSKEIIIHTNNVDVNNIVESEKLQNQEQLK